MLVIALRAKTKFKPKAQGKDASRAVAITLHAIVLKPINKGKVAKVVVVFAMIFAIQESVASERPAAFRTKPSVLRALPASPFD